MKTGPSLHMGGGGTWLTAREKNQGAGGSGAPRNGLALKESPLLMLGLLPHVFLGGNTDPCRGAWAPEHAAHYIPRAPLQL